MKYFVVIDTITSNLVSTATFPAKTKLIEIEDGESLSLVEAMEYLGYKIDKSYNQAVSEKKHSMDRKMSYSLSYLRLVEVERD